MPAFYRVVLDTNVIVSALFWGSIPAQVFSAALNRDCASVSSEELTAELRRVIERPKFEAKLREKSLTVGSILNSYRAISTYVQIADIPINVVRNPKDRIVLATALGGKADFIVSGDKDLLVLNEYESTPIVTPAQFVKLLHPETE